MSYKLAFKKEFELIEPIGKGVSSEVYRGLRIDSESEFSQVVAIKVFKSHKFRKKFQNELKNLSKINHANIVSVKDWGEKDEKFYLVTEYIHGKDLSEISCLIDPQDIKLKRYILNQIFNGIKELKNKGIAHGDLKPSNIMLSVMGELKLVDISFDDLGQVFATPEFTAPEVLTGLSVTFESDLYSLGVISQKLGLIQKKLLALEPGDRRFDLFKGVDDFAEKKKLSDLIRSSFAFSVEAPEVTFESTQELRAEVVPYVGVRPTKSFKMNSLKSFVPHLFLFILLSFGFAPKYPEVKVLKLRSLNAYELWTENQWVSLPVDIVHFETIYNPMQKLKFRNLNGEFTMNISPTLDLSKNIIVDAH